MIDKKILLVSLDEQLRQRYTEIFTQQKSVVIAVANELEAIEFIKDSLDKRIDCVLIDQELERMDGIGLIIYLRKILKFRNHPVILLTNKYETEYLNDAFNVGCYHFVLRTAPPEEIISRTKAAIQIFAYIAEMTFLANYDQLTGLYNKSTFWNFFQKVFSEGMRYGKVFSLCMLDLDNFKQINDTCGHMAGDIVLASVADSIVTTLRHSDIAGRFGGEEFIIIYTETHEDNARIAAERVRKSIENLQFDFLEHPITISIGITEFNKERHKKIEDMIIEADTALYQSKGQGKNQVCLYQSHI